jgi:hypothetical protein
MRTFFILLSFVLVTKFAVADDTKKNEMLSRLDKMIILSLAAHESMEKKDNIQACVEIKELNHLYPAHLRDFLAKMGLYSRKNEKSRQTIMEQVKFIAILNAECSQKANPANVEIDSASHKLKSIAKSLKKQKKLISSDDVDDNNNVNFNLDIESNF